MAAEGRRGGGGRGAPLAALAGLLFPLWPGFLVPSVGAQQAPSLDFGPGTSSSLQPPYFNLAETAGIWATATCGQDEGGKPRAELYCKLVGGPAAFPAGKTIQGQFCDYCNAADPKKAHPVTNAIDGTERWWQSPSLSLGLKYDEVNVTLDLGQLFHVAYVLIKFANSPRPDLWVLERSVDFGRTYKPWQYFAHSKLDCWQHFGKEANVRVKEDDDVICTIEYSRIVPLENGEVVISLVNGRPGANNFTHSPTLREFTKATNIRLHFLRTNTLLGHLISKAQRDPTVTRRYFYSIKDISVGGQCVCHGHAEVCDPKKDPDSYRYQCECQHNTCGETCDRCCPGYHQKHWQPATTSSSNLCEPCNCHGHATDCYYDPEIEQRKASLNIYGEYQGGGVCIDCQHNTAGVNCERCVKGYYRPYGVPVTAAHGCIPCNCSPEHSDGCEEGSGRCYCKLNYQGENCDECADGYHSFPFCYCDEMFPISPLNFKCCECNLAGTLPEMYDFQGRCLCRSEVDGSHCNSYCSGYPSCFPCRCSPQGSNQESCDPATGQCECRPGVSGQQCDRCLSADKHFPYCHGTNHECDPAGAVDSYSDYCQCLQNVEGPTCSICKPIYWNLARENPEGCVECQCNASGTLSGVRECQQVDGECYCKPNVCGDSCDMCEDGYYGLEAKNYFGCQGCECDVGGSVSQVCDDLSGDCQCRNHMVGKNCNEPKKNYYLPDLHHMKYEIEDGTSPNGRGIRFGYDPQEFPSFSWRGYAQMSSIQNEVRITLNVNKQNLSLFRVILRYINPGTSVISGHITAHQTRPRNGTHQRKDIVFPPSREPSFVTVPGRNPADPFLLGPGTWILKIMAEGVLLDYLVLLPRDYFEAPILQLPVREPCTYSRHATTDNCLQYEHLPLERFSCVFGSEVTFFLQGGEYRKVVFQQPSAKHPLMSYISGQEVDLQIRLNVPQVGRYVIVLEYVNEHNKMYVGNVEIKSLGHMSEAKINLYNCKYSFLCRSVVTDDLNRIAVYDLLSDAEFRLRLPEIHFLLNKICIIPVEDFSLEYVKPQLHCIATYGQSSSASCIPSQYETPPLTVVLDALRDGNIKENQITLRGRVIHLGRYVFIIHFYQPESPMFPVEVTIDGGQFWSGSSNASFCPHISGCRGLVMAESQIELDIFKHDILVTVKIPNGKKMVLGHILAVPADSYSYTLLHQDTVDKSLNFIYQCGENSFHITPVMSSEFCRNSVRSLVAAYNNGALPCNCHRNGAASPTCDPMGGQCPCKQNIIGLQCNRCRTGYYGFPFCKPCRCGWRLCDDITGKCICPPQTVKPRCEVCVRQHFGYHPLVGCVGCNCSSQGVVNAVNPECDKKNGQCRCRSGITGRRCDQCAPGSFGFPNCKPCNCNRGGTEPNVCDPQTGVCLCKENVEGIQCDMCRSGSFYLDSTNPKGCTNCFCFGATDICHSTNKDRIKFVEMRNWRLKDVDNSMNIPVIFNPGSNSVVADVQELLPSVCNLYWVAPPSYLGDKLSSYGGYLMYQVKTFGLPSEGMTLLQKRPDVQLTGQQMKLIYVDPNNPLPDKQYYGSVKLVEGNFRHASSNDLVTREELMMVLSRLEGLQIRGLYFTESQRLTLGEVGLEEATGTGSGNAAYNVETCSCPAGYLGDSCQECSPGFYRENRDRLTGRCIPCNCNGNSDRCLDGSGICLNCQHNTAGDNCEYCREGYFGDASQGNCRACRCPYTNSFASGCIENDGDIQCFCREGYTGVHCESCAPGYFGNPLKYGGFCQKCNCPNNGQLPNCDRLTGECINQEPKDIDPHEDCDACDSCVITLLKDLSSMQDELQVIKFQMQNVNASTHTLGQMKHLEDRVKQNRGTIEEIAENNYKKAETLFNNFGKTNQRGKDLISKIQSLNELQKHQAENQGLIKIVRDSLNEYELKLNDLRESLKEAKEQTKLAETLNVDNKILFEDIKNEILDVLDSAEASLSKANSAFVLLQRSKEEYETLAAQLDGARKELTEKLKSHSLAASKEPLVVRAEEHAISLQELAKKLDEIKRNASNDELVACAMKAASAYEDIINAIKAAETAANRAADAANSAKMVLSIGVKNRKKMRSRNYLPMWNTLTQYKGEVTLFVPIKKEKMDKCHHTSLCISIFLLDDIESMIMNAKNMVKNANDITTNVLDELDPIKTDVENIKNTYGTMQSADFDNALKKANNTVNNLTNILPDLFNKITSINQQLMPISNISENINRIRELIQQARDAANKVAIPMRFDGSSGVEVRPPDILEDLKGYTSLSLFLQRPLSRLDSPQQTSDMFVMYLGDKDSSKDYIGMAVRGGRLICAYSLGGNEAEIEVLETVSDSDTREATMDLVKFERIYQYAKLNYIKGATSSSPLSLGPYEDSSGDQYTLLDLNPDNVVFYVGGYPPDFTPPDTLNHPRYEGCIEFDSLNERVLSLYNFKRTFNLNTTLVQPCRRYKEQSAKIYFEGTGYARVNAAPPSVSHIRYEQTIQTTADEGLVFFAENQDKFISLRIEEGHLIFRYKIDSQPPKEKESSLIINNGMDQVVRMNNNNFKGSYCCFHFISGCSFNITTPPFRGCMMNVRTSFESSINSFLVASFSKNGVLGLSDEGFQFPNDFQVGFGFHTLALDGTLLNYNLRVRKVQLLNSDEEIQSSKGYGDGVIHYVTVMKEDDTLRVIIDDASELTMFPPAGRKMLSHPIDLGGNNFEGCIFNYNKCFRFLNSHFLCLSLLLCSFWHLRSHFAVDVRTTSSRGLIFFMGEKLENRYITLYLSKGRFVFLLAADGRKIKIKSKAKYSDGQWHTVAFSQTGEKMRLIVDGLNARQGNIPPTFSIRTESPIYLGGVPSLKIQNIPKKSFVGCLRAFNVGGKPVHTYHQNSGVLPCLDNTLEKGIAFFNEGGHVVIGETFLMNLDYKIAFSIRPRSSTSLLIHIGTKQENYFAVYMDKGVVTASGNNGAGEFLTSLTPQQSLCDGKWHSIAVTQKKNTVHLDVDTMSNYTTGPSTVLSTSHAQPLYFGRVPANLEMPWLPVQDMFLGCLKDVKINDKPVLIRKNADIHGGVSLQGCPVN
uniref:Laminin subunit alpha 3 n=1 Tax=Anolis carolinensis TaxID=28377 RepID=A0A803T5R5_ANOCA